MAQAFVVALLRERIAQTKVRSSLRMLRSRLRPSEQARKRQTTEQHAAREGQRRRRGAGPVPYQAGKRQQDRHAAEIPEIVDAESRPADARPQDLGRQRADDRRRKPESRAEQYEEQERMRTSEIRAPSRMLAISPPAMTMFGMR